MTQPAANDAALFIDWENIKLSMEYLSPLRLVNNDELLVNILGIAERYGTVVVARAYAEWHYFDRDQPVLYRRGVEPVYVPPSFRPGEDSQAERAQRGKSTADIRLVVDVFDCLLHNPSIGTVIIVSGDGGFANLAIYLRRTLGKRVIAIGVTGTSSRSLQLSVDKFEPITPDAAPPVVAPAIAAEASEGAEVAPGADAVLGAINGEQPVPDGADSGAQQGDVALALPAAAPLTQEEVLQQAFGWLETIVRTRTQEERSRLFSEVSKEMERQHGFRVSTAGYRLFGDFVKAAQDAGIVRIERKGTQRYVALPSEAAVEEDTAAVDAAFDTVEYGPEHLAAALDVLEKTQPNVTFNSLRQYLNESLSLDDDTLRTIISLYDGWVYEGHIEEYTVPVFHYQTGQPFDLRVIRLNRASREVQRCLHEAYAKPASAWAQLSPGARSLLVTTVMDLRRKYPYLGWSLLYETLTAQSTEVDWTIAYVTAVEAGVLHVETRAVPHRYTGQPFMVTDISVNLGHAEAVAALQRFPQGVPSRTLRE